MPEWKDLTKREKKSRIEKTYKSIDEDVESTDFYEQFKLVNPDIEVTSTELYEFMVRS